MGSEHNLILRSLAAIIVWLIVQIVPVGVFLVMQLSTDNLMQGSFFEASNTADATSSIDTCGGMLSS